MYEIRSDPDILTTMCTSAVATLDSIHAENECWPFSGTTKILKQKYARHGKYINLEQHTCCLQALNPYGPRSLHEVVSTLTLCSAGFLQNWKRNKIQKCVSMWYTHRDIVTTKQLTVTRWESLEYFDTTINKKILAQNVIPFLAMCD